MTPLNREQLEQKNKKELREYADTFLNLVLSMQKRKGEMISAILQATPKGSAEFVEMVPEEETQAYRQAHGLLAAPSNPVPTNKVRLIVHKKHTDRANRPVFFGHNNHTMIVKPGREVDFPAERISALADAVEYRSVWDDDLQTVTGDGGWRLSAQHSYPFSVVGYGDGTEKAKALIEQRSQELEQEAMYAAA